MFYLFCTCTGKLNLYLCYAIRHKTYLKHKTMKSPKNINQKPFTVHDNYDQVRILATNKIGLITSCEIIDVINEQTEWQRQKVQECIVEFPDKTKSTYYSHELIYNDDDIVCDCDDCDGVGTVERLDCRNQSNECCGGCIIDIKCDECDGTGKVEKTIDQLIEF